MLVALKDISDIKNMKRKNAKAKAIPVTGLGGPKGCETSNSHIF
jgi:hypothetical protein